MLSGSSESSSSSSEESSSSDGESEVDDNAAWEDEEDNQHKNETTPPPKSKTSPTKEETSPSSGSKQKWDLRSFLHPEPSLLGPSSVKSFDGPGSNKSEANHYIDDVLEEQPMRAADQVISDDNPPSDKIPDDHDTFSKPLSDEFSPPSLPYKHPVMSPIRSPAKVSYNKTNLSESIHKSQKVDSSPHTPTNTYDNVKCRKRTPSVKSPEVPDRISTPKSKRGRKPKMKPPILSSDSSSSEDEKEIDVDLSSHSLDIKNVKESPKSLPKSPRKSQSVSKTDKSATPFKASKKKEIKQEKQLVEKDSVRLKTEVKKSASKASDCDKSVSDKSDLSSTSSTKLESDSIEKIFDTFQPESLLSPIPNVPEKSHIISVHKEITTVQKEKDMSLNGSVTYCNGKPSVMVQLNLDLLSKHLNLDNSKQVGKDVSVVESESASRSENRTSEVKPRTKLDSAIKPTAIENSKSEKKQKLESAKLTSPDKSSTKVTTYSESCDKSKLLPSVKTSATEPVTKSANDSKGACATQKVLSSKSPDYSSFDSLPIRPSHESPSKLAAKKQPRESLTDSSSSSDSDSSDSEEDDSMEVSHLSPIPDKQTETCVQVSDFKKRKPDVHRTEDSKRRKTASKSPHNKSSADAIHKEEKHEEKDEEWSRKHPVHSNERRNSTSSQHSTHSTQSTRSNQSSRSTLSQHSHSRKKARVEPAKESSSSSSANHTSDHISSSSYKHPIKSEPVKSDSTSTKSETLVVQVNGHVPHLSPPNSSAVSVEGKRTAGCHFWLNPNIKDREERLGEANEYHLQAKKVKHQADAMESGLQQNILYLEAALCFIQSGCAMERHHKVVEAATMFKETHRFVVHNSHFRIPHDPESADKAELKLAVLCLRVQSLLYLKMFMLKKNETVKLKRILEDHNSKSVKSAGSQHKPPPSAPSPHQTNWNRSTGTPSPMSPTPSPVGSVCSVGSAGSMNELTPSKATNGTSAPLAPAGHVVVQQRIHSITQKYFTSTSYLVSCHELWDQADSAITSDIREFFSQLDMDCGRLTMQSSLFHLVRYVKHGLQLLKVT